MAEPVDITERQGLAMATVMARRGVAPETIAARLGLALAEGPRVSQNGPLMLIGVGPGVWLALAEDGGPGWASALAGTLAGLASVADQSSGYRILRFAGPGAGALLQKGVFVDLDPAAFCAGAAAVTVIAHIGVVTWKAGDGPDFDVALFRSYADSFRHWITSAGGPDIQLS